jgi:hypothetical protein
MAYLSFAEGLFMVVLVFLCVTFVLYIVPIYGWFGACLILF